MKRVESFFLSKILYRKVYDEFGDNIGKLWDVYVTTEDGMPRAIGYKIKKDGEIFNYEFKLIQFIEDDHGKMITKVKGAREIIPRAYSYLLSRHLLDKQIVDINGKKVVRVNDLRMAEIAGEYRVIAVDTGILALARRLNMEAIAKKAYNFFNRKPGDSIIMWDNVESLEMINNNLKLSVTYKKLSKLHPADLADILEEMDTKYRSLVFESFDEDLAANILEEIEPEIQANILENLSQIKRAEVLDSMPNDEIADLLDEVDEETAEKILLTLEKEDADEVRELMTYEDETAGSIMNKDFIAFNIDITVQETIEILREMKPDHEVMHYIYIIDKDEKLKGAISLTDLILSPLDGKLMDIMVKDFAKIKDNESIDEAVELSIKYDLLALPVVDEEEKLCGIIIISDIIEDIFAPTWRKKFKKAG
ncbi:magnesium transporter [Clostridium peptidivorans]|uniref:magnesium transporter n=1 Tax=Clostridium peptidivorans TaxID=100174 RepID=UPI000BE34319|nr:CBS domain-containing protein [Clostridium peptidivorans]